MNVNLIDCCIIVEIAVMISTRGGYVDVTTLASKNLDNWTHLTVSPIKGCVTGIPRISIYSTTDQSLLQSLTEI